MTFSLAQESHADVTLVHVIEWPWHEPPPPQLSELPHEQAIALAEFRRSLELSSAERLKALTPEAMPGCDSVTSRVVHGTPYIEILRAAAASHAQSHRDGCPRSKCGGLAAVRLNNEPGGPPRNLSGLDVARMRTRRGNL